MLMSFYLAYLLKTQLRLEAFYSFNERFAKIRSKRFKKAVKGITGNQYSDMIDDLVEEVSKSKLEIYLGNLVTMNLRNIQRELLLEKPKWSRKRTTEVHACPEVENTEATVRQYPSSCDADSGHDEHEVHVDESSGPHELRKSTRLRMPVNYTVDYLEIDDVEKSLEGEMVALASKTMNNLKWEILHFRASPGIILKGEMDFSSMERKLVSLA
ncbi:DNA REPAIR PROTEIN COMPLEMENTING XP-G CELLS-RELATED [Salix purpurea]|uniref:DNA REPAIR PROTEIN COMPLEMENTING XP-G CELLS-RELATED n=1 Tax=Salix purpurea TaxID=77065 RepID=A0A9Q0SHR8_SALPP|nr:DNA REPAIR PROTEIN COMPLEMENTING XP-G CELLS-RELATED [Salix purpurea]